MRAMIELVSPLRCVSCGIDTDGELCGTCAEDVSLLERPWCGRCGTPSAGVLSRCPACASLRGFDRARSLVAFVEPARRLTLVLKRRGRSGLAHAVGSLVASLARREGLASRADVVSWVPGGRAARLAGFDHTELIGRACASALGVPAVPLLRRAHDGPRQADVPLAERRANVQGRFVSTRSADRVLLLDDVFTTGATAEACASALKEQGAGTVDVVTWARTLRRRR